MTEADLRQRMLAAQTATRPGRPGSASQETSALSALSTNDTLLLSGAGWEPVDVCVGASVYGMRRDTVNTWGASQDERASEALNAALAGAVRRLESACQQSVAHGVIGTRTLVEIQPRYVAVNLIGTAVRCAYRSKVPSRPFTSNLSTRAFLLLVQAGTEPLGLASGGGFVRVYRRNPTQSLRQKVQNVELVNPTQALARARATTMAVLRERAADFGGRGIVEISLSSGRVPFAPHVMSFLAWGTVVGPRTDGSYPTPKTVVPLTDLDTSFDPGALARVAAEE